MLTYKTIKDLIHASNSIFEELSHIYGQMPDTACLRRCRCCALLPEMTFVEGLSAFRSLMRFDPNERHLIFKQMVGYFFSNAFEITSCPFLKDNGCLIYPDRFFGCRAYGLWSSHYYEQRASAGKAAKKALQANWHRLGVSLPKTVIDFTQPYCREVKVKDNAGITDAALDKLGERIQNLSFGFSGSNQFFMQNYFSDISYVAAALVYGTNKAVQMKFTIVRDFLATGNRRPITRLLEEVPDLDALS